MKYYCAQIITVWSRSPSMRREWIEIRKASPDLNGGKVSLHAEGVD